MAKKGKERKGYFYEKEEQGVVDYINAETQEEKDRIFNEVLKYPFTKLVESIIRRYKLYPPDEVYEETFNDALSFLMTKLECFKPNKGFKAYSYAGTIVKNFLIYKVTQYTKVRNRTIPYDVMHSELQDNIDYSYGNPYSHDGLAEELMENIVDKIQEILTKDKRNLTENEIKVGTAMCDLLNNWDLLFVHIGSNKFNKSTILLYLKEATLLSTKEIRDASKKFRLAYFDLKAELLDD